MLSRFATLGSGVATDPYWANVSLLLIGNGANGTTTNIKDSSNNNFTLTPVGSTVISTAISPPAISNAGSGTVYFNGTGSYVSAPSSSQWNLGVTWTVEAWLYPLSTNAGKAVSTRASYSNNMYDLLIFSGGCWKIEGYGANNTSGPKGSSNTYSINNWYHVAIVTANGNTKIYVNGLLDYTYANTFTWDLHGACWQVCCFA
jgi:hypothetical protein